MKGHQADVVSQPQRPDAVDSDRFPCHPTAGTAALLFGFALCSGSGLSLLTAWLWWTADPRSLPSTQGPNALWARHSWVGELHSEELYRLFAQRLTTNRISDVFFHAGPLEADGTVPPSRYKHVPDDVTVFMGVPTYEEGSPWGFHPSAENLRSGIRGVRKGLNCLDDRRLKSVGIALFAEWTTDDREWAHYARAWANGN